MEEIAAGEFGLTGLEALLGMPPSRAERIARGVIRSAPDDAVPWRPSSSDRATPDAAVVSAVSGSDAATDLDAVGSVGTAEALPEVAGRDASGSGSARSAGLLPVRGRCAGTGMARRPT